MTITKNNTPPNWGNDSISEFIETARHNTFATFVNLHNQYLRAKNINDVYKKLIDNLINTPEFLAAFFLLRSHSAYLGGVRLAISGQIAETYMVLRGCLEAAIYGVYLSRHKESQEVWLRRHDDEKSLKRVKEEFKIGKLLKFLESVDQRTYQIANLLYARTIDYGAHPNELALTSLISKIEENDKIQYNLPYLSKHTPAFKLSMKTTVQVGICALDIFQNVFSDRYKILGIDQELNKLKVRL